MKSARSRLLVFVPTYNDHDSVVEIVRQLAALDLNHRLLVIDDGSRPALDEAAFPADVLRVRLPDNFGLGICTHVAFDHALAAGYDAVVRIDGDGQHPVGEIRHLVQLLDDNVADIVVACRTNLGIGETSGQWLRGAIRNYFSLASRLLTRGRVPSDVNSGFFALNRVAIESLNRFVMERYPEPQLFVTACREGLRVEGVPVEQEMRRYGRSTLGIMQACRMLYRFNVFLMGELLRRRSG